MRKLHDIHISVLVDYSFIGTPPAMLIHVYGWFRALTVQLSSCDTDCVAHKTCHLYSLVLCRSLLRFELDQGLFAFLPE